MYSSLVVHLGEDRVGEPIDDLINRKCVEWSHVLLVCEGHRLLSDVKKKEFTKYDDLH
jgi:hypothetical protein